MSDKIKKIRNGMRVKKENGITGGMIIVTLFSISLIMLLAIPNIYLDNQIYYESREVAHYQNILKTLREEQTIIKKRLEAIKYKNNILSQERV